MKLVCLSLSNHHIEYRSHGCKMLRNYGIREESKYCNHRSKLPKSKPRPPLLPSDPPTGTSIVGLDVGLSVAKYAAIVLRSRRGTPSVSADVVVSGIPGFISFLLPISCWLALRAFSRLRLKSNSIRSIPRAVQLMVGSTLSCPASTPGTRSQHGGKLRMQSMRRALYLLSDHGPWAHRKPGGPGERWVLCCLEQQYPRRSRKHDPRAAGRGRHLDLHRHLCSSGQECHCCWMSVSSTEEGGSAG